MEKSTTSEIGFLVGLLTLKTEPGTEPYEYYEYYEAKPSQLHMHEWLRFH